MAMMFGVGGLKALKESALMFAGPSLVQLLLGYVCSYLTRSLPNLHTGQFSQMKYYSRPEIL